MKVGKPQIFNINSLFIFFKFILSYNNVNFFYKKKTTTYFFIKFLNWFLNL